ncbi:putative toxin-antitoxin system toxin component, PIN family [Nostoc sp. CHAB 5844]|nr:putative toxin-antitoxin system toxin component, PIN family [Nostoc sp. CHAB 5844]
MMNKQRFVFDTNVLISAFLFSQSKPRQALDLAQDIGIIILSSSVFSELKDVLYRPKFDRYLSLPMRQELIENLTETAQFIDVNKQIDECRDPKDNKYLDLALIGKAECIVTGDNDLLILNPWRSIKILTVKEFLAKKA